MLVDNKVQGQQSKRYDQRYQNQLRKLLNTHGQQCKVCNMSQANTVKANFAIQRWKARMAH